MGEGTDPGPPVVTRTDDDAGVAAASIAVLADRRDVLAARADARAARGELGEELERLEAALRAAVDVKARIRRDPLKAAGVAAGIGFVAVGGPRRVVRRVRHAIFGKPEPLPERMLPEEIEKALRALGDDGAKVRGALERDFAAYVDQRAPERRNLRSAAMFLVLPTLRVLILRYGRQVLDEILSPRGGFTEQLERVQGRRAAAAAESDEAAAGSPPAGLRG